MFWPRFFKLPLRLPVLIPTLRYAPSASFPQINLLRSKPTPTADRLTEFRQNRVLETFFNPKTFRYLLRPNSLISSVRPKRGKRGKIKASANKLFQPAGDSFFVISQSV